MIGGWKLKVLGIRIGRGVLDYVIGVMGLYFWYSSCRCMIFFLCVNMLNIEVCNCWKIVYLYYRVFCIVYLRKDDFFLGNLRLNDVWFLENLVLLFSVVYKV